MRQIVAEVVCLKSASANELSYLAFGNVQRCDQALHVLRTSHDHPMVIDGVVGLGPAYIRRWMSGNEDAPVDRSVFSRNARTTETFVNAWGG